MKYKTKLIIGIVFFVVSLISILKVLLLPSYPDFAVNYYSAVHVLHGENPFLNDERYFTAQVYPPFVMIFFTPLTLIPYVTAEKMWTLFSLLGAIGSLYLLLRLFKIPAFSVNALLIFSAFLFSFPLKFSLGMGQINVVILFFITLFFYFFTKNKFFLSGSLLAFPILLKFFPLLLLPYLLFIKKWRVFFGCCIIIFFLLFLTVNIISLPVFTHYFQYILPDLLNSWKGDYYNQSLSGFLMREINDVSVRTDFRFFLSIFLIIAFAWSIVIQKKKDMQQINLEISAIIILSLLINSFSWQHHFILLLIPFVVIYTYIKNNHLPKKYLFFLIISYLLIASNMKDPSVFPVFLQSHVFYGGVLLYGINLHLLYKHKFYFLKKKKYISAARGR